MTLNTSDEPTLNTGDDPGSFADLGLRPELLQALSGLGYEEPTPIQREAIPPLLEGRDLLGQAATGTGKTAAFALPVLQRMTAGRQGGRSPMALVLVPTRELAVQVSEAIHRYGRDLGARVLPIYGGQPIGRQLRALERGVDVVVATPGRALDHIGRGTLRLDGLQMVVLDEADEMLDMGFADDIEAILQETPAERQTVLFSATMPLADQRDHPPAPPATRSGSRSGRETAAPGEAPLVRQSAYVVAAGAQAGGARARAGRRVAHGRDRLLPHAGRGRPLTESLNGRGYRAEALHGGMSQEQRDRVMGRLRSGTADLLIATDVAARGLDIEQLTHVVNYDVPSAPDSYVHRIGRVGRAGREGVAITLAEPREHRMLKTIERVTKQPDHGREGADRRRPARPAAGADARRAAREPPGGRPGALPRRGRDARRRVRHHGGRARRGEAGARGQRGDGRRGGDPARSPRGPSGRAAAAASPAAATDRRGRAAAPARDDAPVRRRRAQQRDPAAGPGRRDRRRVAPQRARHRGDRDRRPVLARRGPGGGGRRGDRGPAGEQHQGQEGDGPPGARRPGGSRPREAPSAATSW